MTCPNCQRYNCRNLRCNSCGYDLASEAAQCAESGSMSSDWVGALAEDWDRRAMNKALYGEIYSQALSDCAMELRLKSLGAKGESAPTDQALRPAEGGPSDVSAARTAGSQQRVGSRTGAAHEPGVEREAGAEPGETTL